MKEPMKTPIKTLRYKRLNRIKNAFVLIGFTGFVLLLGAAGGSDCDTLTLGQIIALSVLSLLLIAVSFVATAFIEYLQYEVQTAECERRENWLQFDYAQMFDNAEEIEIPWEEKK